MTMPFPRRPWVRALLLGSVGVILIAVACWAPGPMDLDEGPAVTPPAAVTLPPEAAPSLEDGPVFTPYTVKPDIRNRAEIARALEREYPPLLRDAGIGGTTQVWFYIDQEGVVRRVLLNRSSGHGPLDEAALRVASAIQFTPALNRDRRVPVWISLPITFTTR